MPSSGPRRRRGPGWPWQAYQRRGDGGFNVAFKGDLPNMTLGLLLFGLVLASGLWVIGLLDRGAEDGSPHPDAVAACEDWAQLRDDLGTDRLSRDEQVERVREIQRLAEGTELGERPFEVIANRLAQDVALDDHPAAADRACARLPDDQPVP